MSAAGQLAKTVGVVKACLALGISRATWYRQNQPQESKPEKERPKPPRALSQSERMAVLDVMHCERFIDKAPGEVYAALLDAGIYLCSERSMYRILSEEGEVRERRNQLRHPSYEKPELVATGPNQVWSWDITKVLGPFKWVYFYLYVILDIYSRYVVGWLLSHRESAELAKRLIEESCLKSGIVAGELTIHADRGPSMKSKTVAQLLGDLGVTKTHSRPRVSNDNPFSESQFKTLKYCPSFPGRFGSIEDARRFCRAFFHWYNNEHRHSGIARLTPATVHFGLSRQVLEARQKVLDQAFSKHPERFVNKHPSPGKLPEAVWINQPERCLERGDFYSKFGEKVSHYC